MALPTKTAQTAYDGEWDFADSCAPPENATGPRSPGQLTFTLGCFQWTRPRSPNAPLKKGKVQYRIVGNTSSPKDAYKRARAYCQKHNAFDAKHNR